MKNPKILMFWGHTQKDKDKIDKSCLSNWYPCHFIESASETDPVTFSIHYYSAEQYIMAHKALLFNDKESFSQIIHDADPANAKKLGRNVKNFNQAVWDEWKWKIAANGIYLKFSQNKKLKKFLIETGEETAIVEASPYDKIWGIGFSQDKAMDNVDKWGENLLGKVLMIVRSKLIGVDSILNSDGLKGNTDYESVDNLFWKIVSVRECMDSKQCSAEDAEAVVEQLVKSIKECNVDTDSDEGVSTVIANALVGVLKDGGAIITEDTIDEVVNKCVESKYREAVKDVLKCHIH